MATQKVFACDDLRKNILSYVVCDNYICCECGQKCSPLDSVLYKHKTHKIKHFDEYGNEYGNEFTDFKIPKIPLLCCNIDTEYHYTYKNKWIHKKCFYVNPKQFLTNDYREHIMTENSKYADTRLKKTKLYQLICDGNLLFQRHRLKKTREKAKYYEELWYRILVNKMNLVTKIDEEKFKNSKNIIENKTQTIIQQNAVQKTYTIREELFIILLTTMFYKKQINYSQFKEKMKSIQYKMNL